MQEELQDLDDAALARRTRAGALECFEVLVARYETRLYEFLRHRTGNRHDAEDLTQETFVRAYRQLARYDERRAFAPWLFTLARRLAASHVRGVRVMDPLPDNLTAGTEPGTPLAEAEERQRLWRLVRERLSDDQFTALWLKYAEDMSVRDMARVMGKMQVHVKVLLHRGRRALRRAMEETR